MRTILDDFITTFRFYSVGAKDVKRSVDDIQNSINIAATRMGAVSLMWGTGLLMAARSAGSLEDRIIGVARQARISTAEMWKHYRVIRAIGDASGVTGDSMLEGINQVVERTGNIKLAVESAQLVADLIRGARMKPFEAGEMISSLFNLFEETDPKRMRESMDILTYMAKAGSLPIEKMGDIIPRMFASVRMTGITDMKEAAKEVGIVSQLINAITVTPSRTGTAFENMVLDFSNKLDAINQLTGKNFKGNEGPLEIVSSIVEAYRGGAKAGDVEKIVGTEIKSIEKLDSYLARANKIFGRRGIRAFAGVEAGGRLKAELQGDMSQAIGTLTRDSAEYANTILSATNRLSNLIDAMREKLVMSGALHNALIGLSSALQVVVGFLQIMPGWLWSAIFLFIVMDKVIKGAVVGSLYKLVSLVWGFIAALAVQNMQLDFYLFKMGLVIKANLAAIASFFGLNVVLISNPIVFAITAIIVAVMALIAAFIYLRSIWRKFRGEKIETPNLDPNFVNRFVGMNPAVAGNLLSGSSLPVAAPVSRSQNEMAGRGDTVTHINVDARGSTDPNAVRVAVDRGVRNAMQQQYGGVFHENASQEVV
jgi:TP901 family phage tail tape measure protein